MLPGTAVTTFLREPVGSLCLPDFLEAQAALSVEPMGQCVLLVGELQQITRTWLHLLPGSRVVGLGGSESR